MKKQKTNKQLMLPTLRAKMGDWIYYIAFMKMKDIAERVDFAEDIHTSTSLNKLLQRAVAPRSKEISKYLLTQKQRFFNAIIIGVYGGSPKWYELAVKENKTFNPKEIPDYLEGAIGYLRLSGKEDLFAIDGQHRVAAVGEATKQKESLKDEEISVIFVSAKQDENSRQRIRRLFSTLNRYAKPVQKRDWIALDEDDLIAIITRKMLNEYKLFADGRINTEAKAKSIPKSDKCITTIVTLYDVLDIILCNKHRWKEFLAARPSDRIINQYAKKAFEYWDYLQENFKELRLLKDGKIDISKLRHTNGGHLLFRPAGILIITRTIKLATGHGIAIKDAVMRISRVSLQLSDKPWVGLLWESIKKRMITRKENQQVSVQLLYYMIHGDLSKIKLNVKDLKDAYASAINWDEEERGDLHLPKQVRIRKPKKK